MNDNVSLEQKIEGKERLISNLKKEAFNDICKLLGGYMLFKLGHALGGDYAAVVGAYIGLRANYDRNPFRAVWK